MKKDAVLHTRQHQRVCIWACLCQICLQTEWPPHAGGAHLQDSSGWKPSSIFLTRFATSPEPHLPSTMLNAEPLEVPDVPVSGRYELRSSALSCLQQRCYRRISWQSLIRQHPRVVPCFFCSLFCIPSIFGRKLAKSQWGSNASSVWF